MVPGYRAQGIWTNVCSYTSLASVCVSVKLAWLWYLAAEGPAGPPFNPGASLCPCWLYEGFSTGACYFYDSRCIQTV